jgi:hypothetical protein
MKKKTPPLELPTSEEEAEQARPSTRRVRTFSSESSELTFSEEEETPKATTSKSKGRLDKSAS